MTERSPATAQPCVHRWRIEEPHDGVHLVSGECQWCGAVRDFRVTDSREFGNWKEQDAAGRFTVKEPKP